MNFWHNVNLNCKQNYKEPKWTEYRVLCLIRLFRQHPCLWKKDDCSYLYYDSRRLAYEKIYNRVFVWGVSLVEVIMKLYEVRKIYVNELRKIDEAKSTGSSYRSQYCWFDELNNFLHNYLHTDEIETIKMTSEGSYYSSNYCDDDEISANSRPLETPCTSDISEATSASKHNPFSSMTPETSRSRTHRLNDEELDECGSSTQKASGIKNVEATKTFSCHCCANMSKSLPGKVKSSSKISPRTLPPRKVKSTMDEDRFLHSHESCQSIKIGETKRGPITLGTPRSCLTVRKSCDEFDRLAMNVARCLKQMRPPDAAKAQMEIQRLLTNPPCDTETYTTNKRAQATNFTIVYEDEQHSKTEIISILPYSDDKSCTSQDTAATCNS